MRDLQWFTAHDQPLGDFLAANARAFTRAELASRWTRAALEGALRGGRAIRILPGVYCAPHHGANPAVMGEAINLWHPAGLVTGALALHLYAPALAAPREAAVRVTNGYRPRTPAWIRPLQGERIRTSSAPSGVRCTVPELALLDAWRLESPAARRSLVWEALWARTCTWRQLAGQVERAPRVRGRRDLERMLAWFAQGATTPLEVRARFETFADARFRDFEWQAPLDLGGRGARVDMLHRAARVVVELDGDRYHETRDARDADRERQVELAAAGFVTVRFGWRDVVERPDWCRARLLEVVARHFTLPGGT